jgi:hypothetical protein
MPIVSITSSRTQKKQGLFADEGIPLNPIG